MGEQQKKRVHSRCALTVFGMVVAMTGVMSALPSNATAQGKACVPSCRDGYLCYQGRCIVACNPPCGEGERCVGEGECVPAAASSGAAAQSTYMAVDTGGGGSVDSAGQPSTALPATFVGLGGFLLIAGGVTFGTSEWNWDAYEAWWGAGQYVGVSLMTLGAISLITATPFLVRQVKDKREWERQHASALGRELTLTPSVVPARHRAMYGLSLRGRF